MDKKLIMKETTNGRIETLRKFNAARKKLFILNNLQLTDIMESQEREIKTLIRNEEFWDERTEARIAYEQEKYLDTKKLVDEIVELIDRLVDDINMVIK